METVQVFLRVFQSLLITHKMYPSGKLGYVAVSGDSNTPTPHYHPISGVKQGGQKGDEDEDDPDNPPLSFQHGRFGITCTAVPVFVRVSRSHASDTPSFSAQGGISIAI